nr:MAG TPA: hypothetical protein [Caudoviricetes sp.]
MVLLPRKRINTLFRRPKVSPLSGGFLPFRLPFLV